jgi:hypothetical protein
MAREFIKVDRTQSAATQAGLLLQYTTTMRQAYELGNRVRDVMLRNTDNVVFTDIESLFGLPAGKGQIVFDLVNGSVGAMTATFQNDDCKEISERLG